jgi:hypothetical protein
LLLAATVRAQTLPLIVVRPYHTLEASLCDKAAYARYRASAAKINDKALLSAN